MNTFLLLVLIQSATASYEVRMAPIPTLDACLKLREEVKAGLPKVKGVAYVLECVQSRDTTETPA